MDRKLFGLGANYVFASVLFCVSVCVDGKV